MENFFNSKLNNKEYGYLNLSYNILEGQINIILYLDLKKNFPTKYINIILFVKEKIKFYRNHFNDNNKDLNKLYYTFDSDSEEELNKTREYSSNNNLIFLKYKDSEDYFYHFVINNSKYDYIRKGSYEFPIQIKIPNYFSNSFIFNLNKDNFNNRGVRQYKLFIWLKNSKNKELLGSYKNIILRNKFYQGKLNYIFNNKVLSCFSNNFKYKIILNKLSYNLKDLIILDFKVLNDNKNINLFNIRLIQYVEFNYKNIIIEKYKSVILSKNFNKSTRNIKLPFQINSWAFSNIGNKCSCKYIIKIKPINNFFNSYYYKFKNNIPIFINYEQDKQVLTFRKIIKSFIFIIKENDKKLNFNQNYFN